MKKLRLPLFLVLAACVAALLAPGYASAAEVKIAHANLQRALNECDAGNKAKDDLNEEAKKLEDQLNAKQEELKKLKDEIDKKGSVWSMETKEAKERDFRARSQDFQKQFVQYGEDLNRKKQETEARIIDELRAIVEEIAKKKGYQYVFERSVGGLLYAPESSDLTDEVIKTHNKRFKK